jgi:hypothetical protein
MIADFSRIRSLLVVLLASVSQVATATPDPALTFDGSISYRAPSSGQAGSLELTGWLLDSVGVGPVNVGAGSIVRLRATFAEEVLLQGDFEEVAGFFDTTALATDLVATPYDDRYDLEVFEGTGVPGSMAPGALLIAGTIRGPRYLSLQGPSGADFGSLAADIRPLAGRLLGQFADPSSVLALVLNMSRTFTPGIFSTDFTASASSSGGIQFTGQVNGEVGSPVVVPVPAALFMFGPAVVALFARSSHSHRRVIRQA